MEKNKIKILIAIIISLIVVVGTFYVRPVEKKAGKNSNILEKSIPSLPDNQGDKTSVLPAE